MRVYPLDQPGAHIGAGQYLCAGRNGAHIRLRHSIWKVLVQSGRDLVGIDEEIVLGQCLGIRDVQEPHRTARG